MIHLYRLLSAIDNLLANTLEVSIQKKLGDKTFQKIADRLKEHYGITVLEAIRDFQKMDATLREFFGAGADQIEKDFLTDFVSLDNSKSEQGWISIQDPKLSTLILESFGNPDKKDILDSSLLQPNVILDILNSCSIPKSSGYRMIKELLNSGLLAENGFVVTRDGKKISKYTSLFKRVRIDIQGENIKVQVQLKPGFLKESYLLKVAQGRWI